MARFLKDRKASRGQVPGSLILIGKQKMEKSVINLIEYNEKELVEKQLASIDDARSCLNSEQVSWINIYGIHDLEMMKTVGEIFKLPSLFMEEILNTDQRPKYHDGDTFDGVILKMFRYEEATKTVIAEQLTLILGDKYILTLQEQPGDVFNPVRERIRKSKGRIRNRGNDYLAYAILDTVIDNYVHLIENLGSEVEKLEADLFNNSNKSIVEDLYRLKMEIAYMRKSVRPVRDVMQQLLKSDNSLFQENNYSFLRSLNELVGQAAEAIELYNNMISDQLNIHHTNVSNRGNEVMKVLTIFASIFIPLTFVAGIYGMNFENIPELKFKYGYLAFWIFSILIVSGLVLFFKKKKWF
ncbi:magnesium/cobalt transporter CorA [Bacteroidota bacterium]